MAKLTEKTARLICRANAQMFSFDEMNAANDTHGKPGTANHWACARKVTDSGVAWVYDATLLFTGWMEESARCDFADSQSHAQFCRDAYGD